MKIKKLVGIILILPFITALYSCKTNTVYITQTVPVEITVVVTSKPKPTITPDPLNDYYDYYRPTPTSIDISDHFDYPIPEPYTLIEAEGHNNWKSEIIDWIECKNAAFWWDITASSLILRIIDVGNNNTQIMQYIDVSPPYGTFIIEIEDSSYQVEIYTTGDWKLYASCEPFLR